MNFKYLVLFIAYYCTMVFVFNKGDENYKNIDLSKSTAASLSESFANISTPTNEVFEKSDTILFRGYLEE